MSKLKAAFLSLSCFFCHGSYLLLWRCLKLIMVCPHNIRSFFKRRLHQKVNNKSTHVHTGCFKVYLLVSRRVCPLWFNKLKEQTTAWIFQIKKTLQLTVKPVYSDTWQTQSVQTAHSSHTLLYRLWLNIYITVKQRCHFFGPATLLPTLKDILWINK